VFVSVPHLKNAEATRTLNSLKRDAVAADCFDVAGDYQESDRVPCGFGDPTFHRRMILQTQKAQD